MLLEAIRNDLCIYASDGDQIGDGSLLILDGARPSSVSLCCLHEGVWDVASSHGLLYWPPHLKGAGNVAASAALIARIRPLLAGAGGIAGPKAVAWGQILGNLSGAGILAATAFVLSMIADFTALPAALWILFREKPRDADG